MTSLGSSALPVIDITKVISNDKEYGKKIIKALETEGFLYVDGVNVDFSKLYRACEWFFCLPFDVKLSIARRPHNPHTDNYYRGYCPVVKGEASRKELYQTCPDFDIKQDPRISTDNWMYENVPWPPEDGTFDFKEFMMDYYHKLTDVSMIILRLVCVGLLGLEIQEDAFEETFAKLPLSTLRLIHYPSWEGSETGPPQNAFSEVGRLMTTPDHADTPFLTLLHTFHFEGLEMLDNHGNWQPVPCRPNSYVMNIGDTFSRMMGGRFKSTRHRVMDIGKDRFSVPFFLEPCFYADVGVNWITQFTDKDAEHVEEPYGPWMINVIKHVKTYAESRFLPEFEYNLDLGPVGFNHANHPPVAPTGSWDIDDQS